MEAPGASGLPKFKAGGRFEDEFTASRMNAIVDYVRASTPLRGVGTLVKRTAAGTTIDAIKNRASAGDSPHDYTVVDASTDDSLGVTVTPGNHFDTVAAAPVIPTIGGVAINTIPAPVLPVTTGDQYITFGIDTGGGGGAILGIVIESYATMPASGGFGGVIYTICSMITDDGTNVIPLGGGVSASQVYQNCGDTALFNRQ